MVELVDCVFIALVPKKLFFPILNKRRKKKHEPNLIALRPERTANKTKSKEAAATKEKKNRTY